MNWKKDYAEGVKDGVPIGLGYIPVAFTYGFMAVSGGLPVWVAVLISLTNLTSAGQFAGTSLIFLGAGYLEVALTVLVINLRYMLMSLSLTQKLEPAIGTLKRMSFAFGITDETFVVSSLRKGKLSYPYMLGVITMPIVGWNLGTFLGGTISGLLTPELAAAMGIGLYAMFIALIIPPARESFHVLFVILAAVGVNLVLRYVPVFGFISPGFRIILATVAGAAAGALRYPMAEEEAENAA